MLQFNLSLLPRCFYLPSSKWIRRSKRKDFGVSRFRRRHFYFIILTIISFKVPLFTNFFHSAHGHRTDFGAFNLRAALISLKTPALRFSRRRSFTRQSFWFTIATLLRDFRVEILQAAIQTARLSHRPKCGPSSGVETNGRRKGWNQKQSVNWTLIQDVNFQVHPLKTVNPTSSSYIK